MKIGVAAVLLAVALVGAAEPVTAHAECGDPDQPPCTDPVPTADEVVAIMAELTDPNKPAASKTDIARPGFSPEEAATLDHQLQVIEGRHFPFLLS